VLRRWRAKAEQRYLARLGEELEQVAEECERLGGRASVRTSNGIAVTTIPIPLVRTAMLAPTRIYDAFPALGAEQAARRIGWTVVKRPVRVAPRWSTLLEVVHAMARRLDRMNRRKCAPNAARGSTYAQR